MDGRMIAKKKTKQDQRFFRSILLSTHMWIKSDHRDSVCEYGGKLGKHFILEAPLAHLFAKPFCQLRKTTNHYLITTNNLADILKASQQRLHFILFERNCE